MRCKPCGAPIELENWKCAYCQTRYPLDHYPQIINSMSLDQYQQIRPGAVIRFQADYEYPKISRGDCLTPFGGLLGGIRSAMVGF